MARPFIQNTFTTSGNNSSFSLSVPTGVINGDFLLTLIRSDSNTVHTVPSGWNQVTNDLKILDYTNSNENYALSVLYRTASSEPSSYTINIESGRYVSSMISIRDTNGIDSFRTYQSGNGCINCINYGTKTNYLNGMSLNVFAANIPLMRANLISSHHTNFDGTGYDGVSLAVSSGSLQYSTTGVYSPPSYTVKASGNGLLNSGVLYNYPPSVYYCSLSMEFKPTGV